MSAMRELPLNPLVDNIVPGVLTDIELHRSMLFFIFIIDADDVDFHGRHLSNTDGTRCSP